MKRKNLLLLMVAMLIVVLSVAFVACDEKTSCGSKHAWNDGDVVVEATCTSSGRTLYTCEACGKQKEVVTPKLQHSVIIDEAVEPTCAQEGLTEGSHCEVCDKVLTEQAPVGKVDHNIVIDEAVEPTCTEIGLTKGQHCLWCDEMTVKQEEIPATGHVYKKWIVDEEPTCDKSGSRHQICTDCNETIVSYEEIPATGHTAGKWIEDIAPTCSVKGSRHQVCSVCNATIKVEEIECIPHTYDKVVITKNPTCTETGLQHKECVCGARLDDEIIEKSIHIPSDWITTKHATCQEEGSRHQVCLVCETEVAVETIAKKAHEWGEWTTTIYATCENAGEKTRTCVNCPQTDTISIDKLGHAYGAWTVTTPATCEAKGEEARVCDHDKTHVETREISAIGHAYGAWTVTTPATCTTKGEESRVCDHDATHVETRETGLDGHTPGEFEEITPVTCVTDGKKEQKCTVCHEILHTIIVPATGHTKGTESIVVKEPTCIDIGTAYTTCAKCDAQFYTIIPANGHNEEIIPSVPATCLDTGLTEGKKCTVCGDITLPQEEVPALGHDLSVKFDKDNHWMACSRCDYTEGTTAHHMVDAEVGKDATCTEDGYHAGQECSDKCGYIIPGNVIEALGHEYSTEWTVDVEPTCTTVGSKSHHCTRCDDKADITEIPAKGHTEVIDSAVAPTCENTGLTEGKHCSVCNETLVAQEVVKALGHAYGEWTTTKDATCTEAGEEQRVCSHDASHIETREIKATGHTEVVDNAVAPTCTEAGLTEGKHCSACDAVLVEQKVVPATGHAYGDWTITKNATCTEAGEKQRVCANDNSHVEKEVIPATGHNVTEWEIKVAATCSKEGKKEGLCDNCAEIITETIGIDPNAHTFVDNHNNEEHWQTCSGCNLEQGRGAHVIADADWEIKVAATCTTEGKKEGICEKCYEIITGTIPVDENNHAYTWQHDEANTTHWQVCDYNNAHTTEPVAHNLESMGKTDATCTTDGKEEFMCKDCEEIIIETIKALGHAWDAGTVTTPATCSAPGELTKTCTTCKTTTTEEIAIDGSAHEFVDYAHDDTTHWQVCKHNSAHTSGPVAHNVSLGLCACGKQFTKYPVKTYAELKDIIDSGANSNQFVMGVVTNINSKQYTIEDESGNTFVVYNIVTAHGKTVAVDDLIVVYGMTKKYNSTYEVEKVELLQLNAEEVVAYADFMKALAQEKADAIFNAINIPAEVSENFDITCDSSVTLSVPEGTTALTLTQGEGGMWHATIAQTDADQTVAITASVTIDGYQFTRDYSVTIKAAGTVAAEQKTVTIDFSTKGFANAADVTSVEQDVIIVTFSGNAKYYNTGAAIRCYGGSTMTITGKVQTISKIELTFDSGEGSNEITTDSDTYTNGTWSGNATSVTFTIGGTSGHRRIKTVTITYTAIPPCAEHTFGEWTTTQQPTCSVEGKQIHTCTVCGFVEEQTVVVVEHAAAEGATWETDGTNHWHVCSMCGTQIEKAGHTAKVNPETGKTYYVTTDKTQHYEVCSVCSKDYGYTDHSYTGGECVCGQKELMDEDIVKNIANQLREQVTTDLKNEENKVVLAEEYKLPTSSATDVIVTWSVDSTTYANTNGITLTPSPQESEGTVVLKCTVEKEGTTAKHELTVEITVPAKVVQTSKEIGLSMTKTTFTDFTSWGTSYQAHTVSFAKLGVTELTGEVSFSNACRQTGTITDMPVLADKAKGQNVTVKVDTGVITNVVFHLTKWNTDKITTFCVKYSVDGTTWTTVSGTEQSNVEPPSEVSVAIPENAQYVQLYYQAGTAKSNKRMGLAGIDITVLA